MASWAAGGNGWESGTITHWEEDAAYRALLNAAPKLTIEDIELIKREAYRAGVADGYSSRNAEIRTLVERRDEIHRDLESRRKRLNDDIIHGGLYWIELNLRSRSVQQGKTTIAAERKFIEAQVYRLQDIIEQLKELGQP